jgi:hypothetical protein
MFEMPTSICVKPFNEKFQLGNPVWNLEKKTSASLSLGF